MTMNLQAWISATVVSAITMAVTLTLGFVSYTHGYIFTRTEGESLTKRVETNDSETKLLKTKIYDELKKTNERLSNIEGRLSR